MLGGGGAQPNISKEKIVETLIPLPPIEEQRRIVETIELWFSLINQLDSSKEELAITIQQAKSKILDLAIHGQLVPQDPNDEPAIELLKRINPKFEPCDNAHERKQLPIGWIQTAIANCNIEILNGFAFQRNKYTEEGIRVIRITNVQDGFIEDDNPKYYSLSCKNEINKYMLQANDLLMSLTGNVGRVGFLQQDLLPAALNQRVGCFRFHGECLAKTFLFYIFQTDSFRKACIASGKGVAQLNISTEWLKSYTVPLPPYAEQLRIVAKIEELFAVLDKIRESIEA